MARRSNFQKDLPRSNTFAEQSVAQPGSAHRQGRGHTFRHNFPSQHPTHRLHARERTSCKIRDGEGIPGAEEAQDKKTELHNIDLPRHEVVTNANVVYSEPEAPTPASGGDLFSLLDVNDFESLRSG